LKYAKTYLRIGLWLSREHFLVTLRKSARRWRRMRNWCDGSSAFARGARFLRLIQRQQRRRKWRITSMHAQSEVSENLINRDVEDAGFTEPAFRHLRALAEMTEARANKVPVPMRLWVEKRPIRLEPTIASVIREEGRSDYTDYGTIEGRLETIQESYGSLQFYIRDVTLPQRVRCYFPEALLTEAFASFRKRVEVSGLIHY
jgi:hypothetical protein